MLGKLVLLLVGIMAAGLALSMSTNPTVAAVGAVLGFGALAIMAVGVIAFVAGALVLEALVLRGRGGEPLP